ncbi:flagellar basal-body MS-ring/collar protein FliF [Priestia flexa]|uniref:Flagellar M-ring protein n=2 Tax=Priestia TaxID=2800373 RepID=A0A0V8JRG4_9BACI|nr:MULTISPECIES: flagellar basal-body MS-ring/collar protein FliF [Priestia]KSU89667.1 flagellar M-ring protein FliF [Priestia veravalensis]MCG7312195.1 flagellar M-ring protein FliF [Priestia flexa]MDW8514591.1 flagellar basal-body MS-ring/collar protein FliF [Priestia flexa]MED4587744.1 flagellar basal-body MS-ring/collar protein FliF [Priestia flexa]WEZ09893.1 flagellar basal-body MS-ring/collar protein FliF [Priestia flexa]
MNEKLALYKNQIGAFWSKRTKVQKGLIIGGPLALLIALIAISLVATNEKFVPLYSNLSVQETGQIKAELDTRKIPSEISENGTVISVPEQHVDSLKVDLAAQGIPDSGSIDYSFFGQNAGFGMTDNEFNVVKLEAMQTEIANLMKNIQGVNNANVMITLPEESVWVKDQQGEASASIVLNTQPGYKFDEGQIKSLYHLVSKSVPNLPTDNIVIMNQNFEYFDLKSSDEMSNSSSFATQHGIKKEIERDVQRQVQQMLGRLVGQDKVMVSVTADVDFTQENREENLVEPVDKENMEGIAVSVERINETFTGKKPEDGGVAGTGEEDTTNYVESGSTDSGDYEKAEERINNEVNRIRKEIVESPYKVRDLGIQVMIDPSNANGEGELAENLEDDIQQVLSTIVRTSISKDEQGAELTDNQVADKIVVSVQPFQEQKVAVNQQQSGIPTWLYFVGGGLLLVILALLFLLLKRRKDSEEEFYEYEEEYEDSVETIQKPPVLSEEQQSRKRLEELAGEQPDEFAKLLRTWISEE